jgi:glyoxylate/hydroxypyruvate reductase
MRPVVPPVVPFVHGLNDREEAIWLAALRGATQELEIVSWREMTPEQADAAQVAIVANPDPADLARMPNLKWVHSLWAGVEKLMPALAGGDLKVARLVDDVMTQTMGEAVLA